MMYFRGYGELEYLEPEAYFSGNYKYIGWAVGDDDQNYDIVLNMYTQDYYYTNV